MMLAKNVFTKENDIDGILIFQTPSRARRRPNSLHISIMYSGCIGVPNIPHFYVTWFHVWIYYYWSLCSRIQPRTYSHMWRGAYSFFLLFFVHISQMMFIRFRHIFRFIFPTVNVLSIKHSLCPLIFYLLRCLFSFSLHFSLHRYDGNSAKKRKWKGYPRKKVERERKYMGYVIIQCFCLKWKEPFYVLERQWSFLFLFSFGSFNSFIFFSFYFTLFIHAYFSGFSSLSAIVAFSLLFCSFALVFFLKCCI